MLRTSSLYTYAEDVRHRMAANRNGNRPYFTPEEELQIVMDPRVARVLAEERGCSESLIRRIRAGLGQVDVPEDAPRRSKGDRGKRRSRTQHHAAVFTPEAVRWLRRMKEKFPAMSGEELAIPVTTRFHLKRVPSTTAVHAAIRRETWSDLD